MFKVVVPGKVFLAGEHAAVYGAVAVVAAIDLECRVEVEEGRGNGVRVEDKRLGIKKELSLTEVREFTERAREEWKKYHKSGEILNLTKIMKEGLSLVKVALGESFLVMDKAPNGLRLVIDSKIPIGSGLGSSAALAVGIVTALLNKEDKEKINKVVGEVEMRQHGIPSGADQAAAIKGGFLRYQKIKGKRVIKSFKPKMKLGEILLIDSGKPRENTAEMVAIVGERYGETKESRFKYEEIFKKIGKISEEWEKVLMGEGKSKEEIIKRLIRENERWLEAMGVVGERAKKIIREIEEIGGAGKICGAGGVEKGSGIILAISKDMEKLKLAAGENSIKFYEVKLGVKGARYEES